MKPNVRTETFDGVIPGVLDISPQYSDYQITFIGLDAGVMTTRAKHDNGTVFEYVNNGQIDLAIAKTLRIKGYQLQALEFTIEPEAAYTVTVKQMDGDTQR